MAYIKKLWYKKNCEVGTFFCTKIIGHKMACMVKKRGGASWGWDPNCIRSTYLIGLRFHVRIHQNILSAGLLWKLDIFRPDNFFTRLTWVRPFIHLPIECLLHKSSPRWGVPNTFGHPKFPTSLKRRYRLFYSFLLLPFFFTRIISSSSRVLSSFELI